MKKTLLLLFSFLTLITLTACGQDQLEEGAVEEAGDTIKQTITIEKEDEESSSESEITENEEVEADSESDTNEEPKEAAAAVKTFTMEAKQWEFIPSTITVNEGDEVELIITSTDVKHGIAISAFGIREDLNPGKTTTIKFTANKKGTHSFRCSVQCGSGHGGMTGSIIVK